MIIKTPAHSLVLRPQHLDGKVKDVEEGGELLASFLLLLVRAALKATQNKMVNGKTYNDKVQYQKTLPEHVLEYIVPHLRIDIRIRITPYPLRILTPLPASLVLLILIIITRNGGEGRRTAGTTRMLIVR